MFHSKTNFEETYSSPDEMAGFARSALTEQEYFLRTFPDVIFIIIESFVKKYQTQLKLEQKVAR